MLGAAQVSVCEDLSLDLGTEQSRGQIKVLRRKKLWDFFIIWM
jgi:hypothetical protein